MDRRYGAFGLQAKGVETWMSDDLVAPQPTRVGYELQALGTSRSL